LLQEWPDHDIDGHLQVAKPYIFQQKIDDCLKETGVALAREDNIRLAGVQWIDNVRKALKLYGFTSPSLVYISRHYDQLLIAEPLNRPVRTYDTAVVYYHKFRLVHADGEYSYVVSSSAG
jgi:CTD kinase subunit beta